MRLNKEFTKSPYRFLGFVIFGILIITGVYFYSYYNSDNDEKEHQITFVDEQLLPDLTNFDPNQLTINEWINLGFTKKQAKTILKYKDVLGGRFNSKGAFKKCYAVSDEMYEKLEPFIMLPERTERTSSFYSKSGFYGSTGNNFYEKKTINVTRKFNPDSYTQNDWENLGFSEKQSEAILKYKNYLGGSFVSKEKFKECFVISDQNYAKLAPYLILPEKTPENFRKKIFAKSSEQSVDFENFDPNLLNKAGWKSLGFSEKQAQVIINYRDKILKGSFKSLDDIKNCYVISNQKFDELEPYIKLDSKNFHLLENENPIVNEHKSSIDFSKININEITYNQLIDFGFSKKSASNFIDFRKKLGGFVNKNQVYETYSINRDLAEKLVQTAYLNSSNVEKYSLLDAPESWLKTHPYFKYSADKIIYYRVSIDKEKKIWKKMNLKPEYEAKMQMYLLENN